MLYFKRVIYFGSIFFFLVTSTLVKAEGEDSVLPARSGSRTTNHEQRAKGVTLEECVKFSIENSFEVKLAKLDLYVAETDLMYSESVFDTFLYGGASYSEDKRQQLSVFAPDNTQTNDYYAGITKKLPTGTELKAELGDTRAWDNSAFVSKNPSHSAELFLEARQPVAKNTFGYVDRSKITLTRLAIMNTDLQTKNRIEDYVAKVEKAFWDLVYAKAALEIYDGMLKRAQKLYEVDRKNFDLGLAERVNIYASEGNLARVEAEYLIVKNNYRAAEEALKMMMNMPEERRISPVGELEHHYSGGSLEDCLKTAFAKRRDYKIRKRDVDIKGLNLKVKGNEKWPEIDLVASMALNGIEEKFAKAMGKTVVADNTCYYAGVEVTLPVENQEGRSQYKRAEFEKTEAIVSLKEVERNIITEVGNAYREVMALEASLIPMKKAVELESKKLGEEEKRFVTGRSSTKRIIDYQRDLLIAQLEDAKIFLRHRKADIDLARSMDTLLDKYEGVL